MLGVSLASPRMRPWPVMPAWPRAMARVRMSRSPVSALPLRSVSMVRSSGAAPVPAKRSPRAWMPPLAWVGPCPPGTAAPRSAVQSASSRPASSRVSFGRKGPSGARSTGWIFTTMRSGVGWSVFGSGAVLSRSSRFCFSASSAAFTTTSSGSPARRSSSVMSRSEMPSSRGWPALRSTSRTRPSVTSAWSTRTAERSRGSSLAGAEGVAFSRRAWSRSTLVVPSFSRTTFTTGWMTAMERTSMSLPRERSALRAATRTLTSLTWAKGTPSSAAAPTSMPETVAPRPVRKVVETRPTWTGRPSCCDSVAASAWARRVRTESRTSEATKTATTRTATTMARTRTQRFWKGEAMGSARPSGQCFTVNDLVCDGCPSTVRTTL